MQDGDGDEEKEKELLATSGVTRVGWRTLIPCGLRCCPRTKWAKRMGDKASLFSVW